MYLKSELNKALSQFTGQPIEKIYKDTDRDNFMTPAQAVEYGLIDAVVKERSRV